MTAFVDYAVLGYTIFIVCLTVVEKYIELEKNNLEKIGSLITSLFDFYVFF